MRHDYVHGTRELSPVAQAEVSAHNAFIDELRAVRQFARGIPDGIVHGAVELGNSISPRSIDDAVRHGTENCRVAAHYYARTPAIRVASDAWTALQAARAGIERIGRSAPEDQGRLTGKLWVDLFGFELASKLRTSITPRTLEPFNSAQEFDKFTKKLSPKRRLQIGDAEQLRPSDDFCKQVDALLEKLPRSMKQFLAANDIRVIAIKHLSPLYDGPASGLFIRGKNAAMIFIAEKWQLMRTNLAIAEDLELTIQHELAHALDCYGTGAGGGSMSWFSDLPSVRGAFNEDLAGMSTSQREAVFDFLGGGSKQTARREAIAEIVSRAAVSHPAFDTMQAAFPRLTELAQSKTGPFQKLFNPRS